jgi:hypothetical protein
MTTAAPVGPAQTASVCRPQHDPGPRDPGAVSNRVARRRRGRPTPVAPIEVDELDAFGHDQLPYVLVNYHRSPLGAWTATLAPDGLEPVTRQASSAHDALHDAMDLIEALSQDADVAISTLHALDGEPTAWAKLAAREGFLNCAITDSAITDSTVADLITHH